VNIRSQLSKIPLYVAYFVLATVPLLFGAVHPIVYGTYVFLILVGLGSWLCFFVPEQESPLMTKNWLLPLTLLLAFTTVQAIPLPLSWIEFLSPARALRIEMVNTLAGTKQQYISISDHGLFSLTRTVLFVSLLVYFLSLKALMRTDDKVARILFLIVITLGVFEALYGLFQFLSPRVGILWLPLKARAASGTIIYKNQYASFLNMCWPLALAGATICLTSNPKPSRKKSRRKTLRERIKRMDDTEKRAPLFFLASGIILLAVLFSLSRGGIITMFLVILLLNFFLPISRKLKYLFLGLLAVFIVGYGSLLGLDSILSRFDNIGSSGSSRWGIYIASLPMLWDHLLSGVGLGSYTLLSPVYLKDIALGGHVDRAHNEYLQLAIEIGLPAALLFFSWLGYMMFKAGKKVLVSIKTSGDQIDPLLIIGSGAFCGLTGFFIHGFVDFGWRLPANLFYAVTLAALVSHSIATVRMKHNKG
jgi:hypothetical protein